MPAFSYSLFAVKRYLGSGRPRLVTLGFVGLALILFSFYHFLAWHSLLVGLRFIELEELYAELFLSFAPLGIFLLFVMREVKRGEQVRLTSGYNLRIDTLQKRLNEQEDLLSLVANHDSESIVIFDSQNRFWYINATAAQELEREVKDVIGQPLEKVIGYERARKMKDRLERVRATGKEAESLDPRALQDGSPRFMRSRYQLVNCGNLSNGVMVREEDVTNLLVARERRETALRQIIATLVAVVDRRDPYAAGHSARVGQLSRLLAEELVLGESDIETAEIAGSLMNFGKVLVPRSILTKTSALTSEELKRVRESILTSADILSLIDFSGDVVPTLRQVLERFDGTGAPRGLRDNAILVTARIVAVANTFVALVSSRAHRPSMDSDSALKILKRDADKQFDPRIVETLEKCLQTKGKQLDWLASGQIVA
ncbi:MAG: HD domain-containing phosphohydrolase [Bdellovibrionales bacterium]